MKNLKRALQCKYKFYCIAKVISDTKWCRIFPHKTYTGSGLQRGWLRSCGKEMFSHVSVCSQGGLPSHNGMGQADPPQRADNSPPPPPLRVNRRAVCVLLECTLLRFEYHQCLYLCIHVYWTKRPGWQKVSTCGTRSESEKSTACRPGNKPRVDVSRPNRHTRSPTDVLKKLN